MDQDFSKRELILSDEVKRLKRELQESQELLHAIQRGEVDAVVVNRDHGEQIYVLDDANITYRKMVEEMNEGAVTFNHEGVILYANKAFARLTKYGIGQVISKPVTDFFNPEFLDLIQNLNNLNTNDPVKTSINLLDKNGKTIPVLISLHNLVFTGIEIILMTVTDQREKLYIEKLALHQATLERLTTKLKKAKEEAENAVSRLKEKNLDYSILNHEYITINNILAKTNEELLIAKEKAEKSDNLKTAFIANMSHEIRTPLNSILGYTNMLKGSIDDTEQKKHIDVIIHSGKHLLHLINDIVDLSILDTGEMNIFESEVVLNDMMHRIKTQLDAYALNKGIQHIELRLILPTDSQLNPVVLTDEYRVAQILNNLLSNALKFTREGSVEFGYEINDLKKELLFFVRDTGTGISKKDQEVLFKRFSQGRVPSKDVVISGTGLGLAISKGLTDLMEGEIWVESKAGQGSTFYFTIPYKKAEPEATPKPEEEKLTDTAIPRLMGKRILLSEDDPYSREMMLYLLKKTNAEVLTAKDGRETIEIFQQNDVDLVLLDLRMPEMDGYQALKEIRLKKPDALVIVQTAYAMQDDIRNFSEVGFDDYLTKPISDTDLFGLLNKYFF
jgi:PAS domain S-box-containing protein